MNMDMNDITILEVKDIAIAAYLYASNELQLVGKRKLANGAILLQFTPQVKADELIQHYWNLTASPIQPKLLFSAFRDIKDMLFSN